MTFDLDLDLQHILDAVPPGNHCVRVLWRSTPFVLEKKRFAQMFTDGRTDDARRTMAYSSLRLGMS